jgi:hypothetical protein
MACRTHGTKNTRDKNSSISSLQDETVWLTQKLIAELFQKDVRTINEHIKNIYSEGELEPGATIRKFRIVQKSQPISQPIPGFCRITGAEAQINVYERLGKKVG